MNEVKKRARIAGALYLALGVTGVFGILYVTGQLIDLSDAAATIANLRSSEGLLRLGFVSNIVSQTIFLFLALAFYRLFEEVDKAQARLLVTLVVASVPITFLNMLSLYAPVLLLSDAPYLSAFEPAQLEALSMVLLDMHYHGISLVEVFWGLWLLPLGILVYKSRFFPRILGLLLGVGCIGYLLEFLSTFLFPASEVLPQVALVATLGELPFMLWLVILGARFPKAETEAAAA